VNSYINKVQTWQYCKFNSSYSAAHIPWLPILQFLDLIQIILLEDCNMRLPHCQIICIVLINVLNWTKVILRRYDLSHVFQKRVVTGAAFQQASRWFFEKRIIIVELLGNVPFRFRDLTLVFCNLLADLKWNFFHKFFRKS